MALLGFGLVLAVAIAEALLRLVMPAPSSEYGKLTRAFAEVLLEDDAALHHRPKPNVSAEVGGISYRFDGETLRGSGARTNVLAVGDSVTMGWGVAEEAAWPARLRPVAMNAGVLGYGVREVVSRARALLERLGGVKTLLVGYYPNDPESVEDNTRGAQEPSSWALLRLVKRLGQTSADERYRQLHAVGSPGWARARAGFEALGQLRSTSGIRVVVVLLPALEAFDDEGGYLLSNEHRRLATLAAELGLEVVDLSAVAASLEGGPRRYWVAPDDPHPNASMHSAYAAEVSAYLERQP